MWESSRIIVYNALAVLILLYGWEILHPQTEGLKWVISFAIKFFSRTVGQTLFYYKNNEDISEKLEVEPVNQKLRGTTQIGCNM
jgi:hypothetical protein